MVQANEVLEMHVRGTISDVLKAAIISAMREFASKEVLRYIEENNTDVVEINERKSHEHYLREYEILRQVCNMPDAIKHLVGMVREECDYPSTDNN